MKVFKYEIPHEPKSTIEVPEGAKILKISIQPKPTDDDTMSAARGTHGVDLQVYMWALVDENAPLQELEIFSMATGRDIPDDLAYLGMAQLPGSQVEQAVFHVFVHRSQVTPAKDGFIVGHSHIDQWATTSGTGNDQKTPEDALVTELLSLAEEAASLADEAITKKDKHSGTRARKILSELKKKITPLRDKVFESYNKKSNGSSSISHS